MITIYDGIEETAKAMGLTEDLQGWEMSTNPLFRELIAETRPTHIIEVGSWKGRSAIHMADLCDSLGLTATKIFCVDTWLGGVEHVIAKERDFIWPVERHGHPSLWWQFLLNVKLHHHENRIVPLLNTSTNIGRLLSSRHVKAELIYIDGSHQYEDVTSDLTLYASLLANDKSIMFGDDYQWPTVKMAADRFAFECGFDLTIHDNLYVLRQKP